MAYHGLPGTPGGMPLLYIQSTKAATAQKTQVNSVLLWCPVDMNTGQKHCGLLLVSSVDMVQGSCAGGGVLGRNNASAKVVT